MFVMAILCLVSAFALFTPVGATAGSERQFVMAEGAYIRIDEPAGIRFEARFNQPVYDELFGVEAAAGKTLGMIIVPSSYVTDCNGDAEYGGKYYEYFRDVKGKMLECTYAENRVGEYGDGIYYIRATVTEVLFENSGMDFIAIAYIRTQDGETASYEYADFSSEVNARSVAKAAKNALNDNSSDLTAEQYAFLRKIVDDGYYSSNGVTYDKSVGKYVYNEKEYESPAEISDIAPLKLSAYYDGMIPVGNSDGNAFLYPLSEGPVYGSKYISTDKAAQVTFGREDVYTIVQTGADVLKVVGVNRDYLTANGYNKLSMKLYFTDDFNADDVLFSLYVAGEANEIRFNGENFRNYPNVKYYRLSTAEGETVQDVTADYKNQWLTFDILIDGADDNVYAKGLNFEMCFRTRNYGKTLYVADVKFVSEDAYPEIKIENSDGKASLTAVYGTKGSGTYAFDIKSVGTFNGKDGVYAVKDSGLTRRAQGLTVTGVTAEQIAANGYESLSFDVYYTGTGHELTVFGYSDEGFSVNKFAATLSAAGEVSGAANYITVRNSAGEIVSNVSADAWYTVTINIGSLPANGRNENENINFWIFEGLNLEYYLANVKFVEKESLVGYTVKHYKRVNGVFTEFAVDNLSGLAGLPVKAEKKTVDGYLVEDENENAVPSGFIKADGSLELSLYYGAAIPVGNSDGNAYLYSLAGGPVYGSRYITMDKAADGTFGRDDVYTYVQSGGGAVRIVGVTSGYLAANGYNKLSMKLYFTGEFVAERLYFVLYNKYDTYEIRLNAANIGSGQHAKFFCLKDADGNVITDITDAEKDTWVTFEINLDGINDNGNAAGLNLEMRVNDVNYNKTLYVADVKFDKYPSIEIKGSGELRAINKVLFYDSATLKIENAGAYQGKDGVYRITETSAEKRKQGLTITGISPAEIIAAGKSKISFDVYYTGTGHALTVFGYSDDNYSSNVFAATLSMAGDVAGAKSYITVKDANGEIATAIATDGWYTVEIYVTSLIDGATIKAKDVSLWIFDELGTEYYLANVKFV